MGMVFNGTNGHDPEKLNVYGKGENLLDNARWDNPDAIIDQRGGTIEVDGQTVRGYTGAGYGIDRWFLSGGTLTLNQGYLTMTNSIGYTIGICQKLEYYPLNTPLTLSALVRGNGAVELFGGAYPKSFNSSDWTVASTTFSLSTQPGVYYYPELVCGPGNTFDCVAAKLEPGTEQTLAHNEGTKEKPVWVLNDPPPNYQQELAKCQRYYCFGIFVFNSQDVVSGTWVPGADVFPVHMRGTPTVEIRNSGGVGSITSFLSGNIISGVTAQAWSVSNRGFAGVKLTGTFPSNEIGITSYRASADL